MAVWHLTAALLLLLTTCEFAKADDSGDKTRLVVSPIVNRELQASVIAHNWPWTVQNVFCEAHAYHGQDGRGAAFLDALVAQEDMLNDDNDASASSAAAYAAAMQRILAAATPQTESHVRLLQVTLSMRAKSPQCEMERTLARETLSQLAPSVLMQQQSPPLNVFAVVAGQVVLEPDLALLDYEKVVAAAATAAASRRTNKDDDNDNSTTTTTTTVILPEETVIKPSSDTTAAAENVDNDDDASSVVLILYGNLGSRAFATAYQKLRRDGKIPFVVRHLGAVGYEEDEDHDDDDTEAISGTVLQGYGVQLDIRNVEYKVFDDRSDGTLDDENNDGRLDLSKQQHLTAPPQFLAGVNLTALGLVQDNDSNKKLQNQLWSIHHRQATQSGIIPPVWRRRDLSLQAATAIVSSEDPLWTLQEVSQDLPSLASTLVYISVPEEIRTAAAALEQLPHGQPGVLCVNGRAVSLSRPSFNVFELLHVLHEEQLATQRLQNKLGSQLPATALQEVHKAWTMGKNFLGGGKPKDEDEMDAMMGRQSQETPIRIDVGRGWKNAVIYLNDLEKDSQYERWSRSLRQMFMNMQMGGPPSVRRNLFTILAVIDPADDASNGGLDLGGQLMKGQYPARLGLLVVDSNDLEACMSFLETENPEKGVPCPIKDVVDPKIKVKQYSEVKVGAQIVHHFLVTAAQDLAEIPGSFAAYAEYLLDFLQGEENDASSSQKKNLDELLGFHGTLYEGMRIGSSVTARAKAVKSLLKKDENLMYRHSLRFAAERNIKPGMSFINGRPIPAHGGDEVIGQVFGEEQNHVFGLIYSGKITDSKPRSVYAELLTGDRVYKKCHPLIIGGDSEQNSYLLLDDDFDQSAVELTPKESVASEPEAVFVVSGVFDLASDAGVALALQFLSVMDTFPSKMDGTDIGVVYRVLPSTAEAAKSPLCSLFSQASTVGKLALMSALSDWDLSKDVDSLLQKLPVLSDEVKKSIKSGDWKDLCSNQPYLKDTLPGKNFILGNGRYFPIDGTGLVSGDIDLLLSIELERTKAVTKLLRPHLSPTAAENYSSIAAVVAWLSLEADSSATRNSIIEMISEPDNEATESIGPLHLSWDGTSDEPLQVQVIATIDPVSEAAQRMSPLIRIMRDQLQLPLVLLLTPSSVLGSDSKAPLTSYYRFVADPSWTPDVGGPKAHFTNLPTDHILTLRTDVPEPWDVQQTAAVQDTDNLRCDFQSGCGDDAIAGKVDQGTALVDQVHLTSVEYGLKSLLVFGQCYDAKGSPPNGLQLTLVRETELGLEKSPTKQSVEIGADGSLLETPVDVQSKRTSNDYSDTLVMKNVGYWQVRANPGLWKLSVDKDSKGATMFDMVEGEARGGRLVLDKGSVPKDVDKTIVMNDFVNRGELLIVKRKPGVDEKTSIFYDEKKKGSEDGDDTIHVFSLATGHLYERFLKIMMLSVTKRTSSKVKFWLFENFLSPTFKSSAKAMAERIGCEVEFVTYKWPEWLRGQSEKQRIIWGYKILFLDVLFPLSVKKIIYVDADQVVRGDLRELWDMDLQGAPYGYTPFCSSREETLGYQFWRDGFWKSHLRGKPYHISALYVVDLDLFRRQLVGDQLRSVYQQLSADPASLSNLDQDLPNYAQHSVPIFSLPQEWLWCESWCSDESKAKAKTIDLCNNPMHKEPKVSMAKRVISGPLFEESWVELDAEVEKYEQQFTQGLA